MQPSISAIIVNYNAGKLLTKAVKSIIGFQGVEVIVVDNASKDTSMAELAKAVKADNLILIRNHENLGFGKAVNQGAREASGDYLYLLNPDAEVSRSAFSRMVATAKKYHDRALIAPRLENPDGSPQPSCYHRQTIFNAVKEYWFGVKGAYEKYLPKGKRPQPVHIAVAAAWLVPKAVWHKLGGLDDKYFLYFEDLDFCDRANRAGIPVIYDPRAVVKHAHGVSSRTNPIVMQLFLKSALTYHGRVKKLLIDFIILSRNLFLPPTSGKKLLALLLAWTTLVIGVAAFGYFLLPARYTPLSLIPPFYRSNFLLWSWANFDGEHYLRIASDGYQTILGQSQYAFFPLFPLLIRALSQTGLDLYTSAHLLVTASLIAFACALTKWASKFTHNPLALLVTILLSPGAVFLLAVYTEPLFLALTALTFLFAERGQWGRAAFTAALATATRVNGIFLVIFLLIKVLRSHRPLVIIHWPLISLSGLATYLGFLYFQTGSAFSWYTAQQGWGKNQLTAPWHTLSSYFTALSTGWVFDLTHLVVLIEVLVTLLLFYLLIKFWRQTKLDSAYKWYALGNLALPLATGSLGSMPRFSLALFPLFLVIPSLPRFPRAICYLLYAICCTIGIVLFTRGYWYA